MYYMILCLFFFKQKTAYEMRISDWSSDVCSSDLHGARGGDRRSCARVRGGRGSVRQRQSAIDAEARPCPRRRAARLRARRADGRRICPAAGQESNRRHRQRGEGTGAGDAARVNRQRVVEGKRVTVRVELGGRRIITTNNN